MFARIAAYSILAALSLRTAGQAPRFTLGTTGAINLSVAGAEARYWVESNEVYGRPVITVSLGATGARGALTLSIAGSRLPAAGRYAIIQSVSGEGADRGFSASFAAGSPEHPLGWFHGESGHVTITESDAGHVVGEFEIRARGFTSAAMENENQWVTVRGTFRAEGDVTVARVSN